MGRLTKILLAGFTFSTSANLCSNPDSVSNFEFLDSLSDLDNFSNDLMSRDDEWGDPRSPTSS